MTAMRPPVRITTPQPTVEETAKLARVPAARTKELIALAEEELVVLSAHPKFELKFVAPKYMKAKDVPKTPPLGHGKVKDSLKKRAYRSRKAKDGLKKRA